MSQLSCINFFLLIIFSGLKELTYRSLKEALTKELLKFRVYTVYVYIYGVSAGKRDQINKKFFFKVINILDQMIKSTSILLRNFFLKKFSIWFFFPALTPYMVKKAMCSHFYIKK